MARPLCTSASLPLAIAALVALAPTASAAETEASPGLPVCLIGLGAGDGSPLWSQLDVGPSRSVDFDLADGAGLTIACGTFVAPKYRPAAVVAPLGAKDPSAKGDFGSL